LLQYHPSLPDLLRSFYPDFDWQTSKFVEASGSPQRKRNNHRLLKALDRAELDLGLTKVVTHQRTKKGFADYFAS